MTGMSCPVCGAEASGDPAHPGRIHCRSCQDARTLSCSENRTEGNVPSGRWATELLKVEPGSAKAYFERAGTYSHKGDYRAALEDASRACELGHREACVSADRLRSRYGNR